MKKLLFTSYNLCFGGIERALITILKNIDYSKYKVTLLLEKREGVLLEEIPQDVIVKEYKINNNKIVFIRKVINRLKLSFYIIMNYYKFDFSASFTTASIPMGIISRYLSKNNYLWVHSDYKYVYNKNENELRQFFDERKVNKFNKIIFVSKEAKNNFIEYYSNLKWKCFICENLVDYKNIMKLSCKEIKENNKPIILNVSRHEENAKRISRLINVTKKLIENKYNCVLYLVGDGPEHEMYAKMIKDLGMENYIYLLGLKTNPYPYYKQADVFVLTSDYEGFPVVYTEAMVLGLPIITTIPASNDIFDINEYGVVVEKSEDAIYNAIKDFFDNGMNINRTFNPEEFNKKVLNKLDKLFNGEKYD